MSAAPRAATQNEIRAAALIEDLWKDPEIGAAVRAKAKAKFNDVPIPEDSVEPVIAPLKRQNEELKAQLDKVLDRLNERETKDAEAKTFSEMEGKVNAAVREFNLTDEGRALMLDRMKNTGNYTDPDAAAAYVAHKAPKPASLPAWAPKNLDLFGVKEYDEKMAALHRNPEAFVDKEMTEFAMNPDKYVQEAFGSAA